MAVKEFDLEGGDSVYCINEMQLRKAFEMIDAESESGEKIGKIIDEIETDLTRNERAALSFLLIDRLIGSGSSSGSNR